MGAKEMQMKHISKKIFFAVILFVICPSSITQAGPLPQAARLLPAETVFLAEVENFSQLKTQFEKTNLYKLYKDPAMAGFVNDFNAKRREKIQKLDNEIAKAIIDANTLPEGRVAFALVLDEHAKEANEPTVLFIIQWGKTADKIKEVIEKSTKKAVEDGAHRKSEDYRGVGIETIISEDSSRLGYGFSSKLSYCFVDDCLIGSEDIELLKFTIAHIQGAGSPSLADDADYTATIAALGPYHDIDFYVNTKQIIKTAVSEETTGEAKSTITNLGFDNVAAIGCSIGVDRRPGSSYCGKIFVKINGAKKGICKMLEIESAVLKAPRFIPELTYSIMLLNLDIKKAYNELYNIIYSFNPASAAMMNVPLVPAGNPGGEPELELKSGIIDHLGSQIIISQNINKPLSDSSVPEYLFALGVNNRSALDKSLSLLHSKIIAPNNPDARRELLGYTIYRVTVPGMPPFFRPGMRPMQGPGEPATPPQMPTFAFTVTDTHLIWGNDLTVERAIRALSSPEAASVGSAKWFTSAQLSLPTVVGLACLEDTTASSEMLWRIIKQSSRGKDSSFPMEPNANIMFRQPGADLFNLSLLPEFDTVRKYFGSTTLYGISRPDGFFFEFNYLKPSGDN